MVRCEKLVCKARAEICTQKTGCSQPFPSFGCVDADEVKSRLRDSQLPGSCDPGYGWFDSKACDGPGDCKSGEVCCYEKMAIIGGTGPLGDGYLDKYECKALAKKGIPCWTAEVCSEKDPKCVRPGSTCVMDGSTGMGTCEVPRQGAAKCGAAPCAKGLTCMQRDRDKSRFCTDDPTNQTKDASYIPECDRSGDCAPDEECFEQGPRCALHYQSWAGDDRVICVESIDCVRFCDGDAGWAVCTDGFCECRGQCKRDRDCRTLDCRQLSNNRHGSQFVLSTSFCDRPTGRCDCR